MGNYLFMVGLIIAIVLGIASQSLGATADWLLLLLVVIGILAGLFNITPENSRDFLWFTAVLAVIGFAGSAQIKSWGNLSLAGPYLKSLFDSIFSFIVPAGVAAALKEIWILAKGKKEQEL